MHKSFQSGKALSGLFFSSFGEKRLCLFPVGSNAPGRTFCVHNTADCFPGEQYVYKIYPYPTGRIYDIQLMSFRAANRKVAYHICAAIHNI